MDNFEEKYTAAIVGGGAAGMLAALILAEKGVRRILVLERNDRLGRKLSATGNGQGNVTNTDMCIRHYFSSDLHKAEGVLQAFGQRELVRLLTSVGGYFVADGEGRVYPSSRQAASVTDILRFALAARNVCVKTGEYVRSAAVTADGFCVRTDKGRYGARFLILAAGGKASPHFGSDGSGYALAEQFGHTVTPLAPALVQLKTERDNIRGLRGIRSDCAVHLLRGGREEFSCRGDVIFTDYGVSGNAVFRASSRAKTGDILSLDLLPDCAHEELCAILERKAETCPHLAGEDLLRCIVNSALAKAVMRSLGLPQDILCGALKDQVCAVSGRVKDFRLRVTGSMGFENAQVTKGGVPLAETDGYLMSRKVPGLFFAGEILDVDGECGGYNLQWAFSSGARCAERIAELCNEDR